jgi:hypothetical protein
VLCAQGMLGPHSAAQPASSSAEHTTSQLQQHSASQQPAPYEGHVEWHANGATASDAGLLSAMDSLSINGHTGMQRDVVVVLPRMHPLKNDTVMILLAGLCRVGSGVSTPAALSTGMDLSPASDLSPKAAAPVSNPVTEALPWLMASNPPAATAPAGGHQKHAAPSAADDDCKDILAMLLS